MAFYRPHSLRDYFELAKRLFHRKWLILGVFAVVTAASTLLVLRMPKVYKSSALILIQPGEISMTSVNLSINVEQRLRNLRPLITSRTTLEGIVNDLGLYPKKRASEPLDAVVEYARRFVEVEVQGRDLFRVSFTHEDPRIAQTVTDRLSRLLIETSVTEDTKRSREKVDFLRQQTAELKRQLKDWDERVKQFREDNADALIAGGEGGRIVLHNPTTELAAELKGIDQAIRAATDRKALLERSRGSEAPRDRPPPADPEVRAAEDAVAKVQGALDQLLTRYTVNHPDVIRAKEELRMAQSELRRAQARAGSRPQRGNPQASNVQREIETVDAELKRLRVEREAVVGRLEEQRQASRAGPKILAELDALERDRKRVADQLDSEIKKLNDAEADASVVANNKGDEFKLQDPANLPDKPDSPRRIIMAAAGAILGLLAGLGVALVLVYFDQTVYNEYELARVTDLPVLVSIAKYDAPDPALLEGGPPRQPSPR